MNIFKNISDEQLKSYIREIVKISTDKFNKKDSFYKGKLFDSFFTLKKNMIDLSQSTIIIDNLFDNIRKFDLLAPENITPSTALLMNSEIGLQYLRSVIETDISFSKAAAYNEHLSDDPKYPLHLVVAFGLSKLPETKVSTIIKDFETNFPDYFQTQIKIKVDKMYEEIEEAMKNTILLSASEIDEICSQIDARLNSASFSNAVIDKLIEFQKESLEFEKKLGFEFHNITEDSLKLTF